MEKFVSEFLDIIDATAIKEIYLTVNINAKLLTEFLPQTQIF